MKVMMISDVIKSLEILLNYFGMAAYAMLPSIIHPPGSDLCSILLTEASFQCSEI